MNVQIVLAGVGGQGILFSTKLLAETAIRLKHNVIGSETHGMSQRGGSVVSYLKIGGFSSPLLRTGSADCLLSFEVNEAYRNIKFIRPASNERSGGLIYVNSQVPFPTEAIRDYLARNNIRIGVLNGDEIALKLNAPLVSNLIVLGFACKDKDFPFDLEELISTAEQISPPRFRELNIKALSEGYKIS